MQNLKELWLKMWVYIKPVLTIKGIYNFLTSRLFLVIVVLLLLIIIGRSCANTRDLRRRENIQQQNINALTDSIKIEKQKSGSLEFSIAGYIASEKELKDLNRNLYNEIKSEKGQVISLTKTIIELKQNEIQLRDHINYLESKIDNPIQLNDTLFAIPWGLKYDWDNINYDFFGGRTYVTLKLKPGYTWRDAIMPTRSFNTIVTDEYNKNNLFTDQNIFILNHYKTELVERISQIDLVFKEKVENGQYRVYVETKYPGFTLKSLEGVMIDPNTNPYIKSLMKKKKWIPNTWAVGVGPSFGYDFLSNKTYLGIGVGIKYNLLQW